MTVLAIRLANVTNGVSKLHGSVSRKMWKNIWPELPESEVPITSITNGVHTPSWVSPDMTQLYDRYLGTRMGRPTRRFGHLAVASKASPMPNCGAPTNAGANGWWPSPAAGFEEQLQNAGRCRLRRSPGPMKSSIPEALTIGFARRFATYKRGTLIFRNLERLTAILNNKDRPVQLIFAGKAHPQRSRRQGTDRRDPAYRPAARVPPPHRLHRRLRHERGPLPGPGRGRVAEQSPPAAGSVAAPAA